MVLRQTPEWCTKEFLFKIIIAIAKDALIPPVYPAATNPRLSPSLNRSGQDPPRSMEPSCPAQDSSPTQQDGPPGGHQRSRAQRPSGYPFTSDRVPESQPGSSHRSHQCSHLPDFLPSLLPSSCHKSLTPHPCPSRGHFSRAL